MNKQKTYVVTGGNGYIGQHMCKYLHQAGHQVHIIDNFCTSPKHPVHQYGIFHQHDIGDKEKNLACFKSIGKIDGIFHFAARAVVPEGEEKPLFYYQENVVKTFSLVESAIEYGISHFIFSSTCATVGIPPQGESISETTPQNPINTYGNTKKIIELFLKDLAQKKKIRALVFRYFNVAGCSPEGELGENHDPETHLIPVICLSHLNKSDKEFKIFGHDYQTLDGTCIRDYIHVMDLARAHALGARYLEQHSEQDFIDFNLGSEQGYSVLEVVSAFERVSGTALKKGFYPRRSGDPDRLVANSQKIQSILNFKTEYTLDDCIRHTLDRFHKGLQK